jgi:tetratricopeptide (TPR) repeat protein
MKRRTVALLTLIILSSISTAGARQVGNSIRGKVRTSSGTPMPRVVVELLSSNGQPINQTVTNNEGDFFFGNLSASGYQVVVSVLDYNTATERIDFSPRPLAGEGSPGETRTVEITLAPKGSDKRPLPPPGSTLAQTVPKEAGLAFDRGMKLSKEGKSDEAITALREAVKLFPDYFNAHFMLGQELSKLGQLDEAITSLEQAQIGRAHV